MKIRLDVIDLDPTNPRQDDRVRRLENSIKAVGQIEPVKLRIKSVDGNRRYDMVSGHHRYWALKKLRRKTIDAEIEGMSEDDMEKHRSIAAAFDNREDPDIVKAIKMYDSLFNGKESTPDEVKRLSSEYGYGGATIKQFLGFARFVHEQAITGYSLESLTLKHFTKSSPLHNHVKDRAGLLIEANSNKWSSREIGNKATAMLRALKEAEDAREREELEIAKRREMEAKVIKTSVPAKDSKGRLKTPEVIQAEAEAKVSKSCSKKIKEESWEDKPTSKAVLDSIQAVYKTSVPTWRDTWRVGKFPPEANHKLIERVDKAIEALKGFKQELS